MMRPSAGLDECSFEEGGWAIQEFAVQDKYIKRFNKLTITIMDDSSGHRGPPYLLVNYLVFRPAIRDAGKP